jgi:hypothetical protein
VVACACNLETHHEARLAQYRLTLDPVQMGLVVICKLLWGPAAVDAVDLCRWQLAL